MTFAQRLGLAAGLIDARLQTLLGENLVTGEGPGRCPQRLARAIGHAALGGGKRLRPLLVVESAALFGLAPERAIDAAAAVECVHCYSLAHDDLPAMDDDEVRRGRPTVWKAFDEWTAILAGDALLTLAFEILARPSTHPEPLVRLELVSGLASAAGAAGMVGGQSLDLEAEKLGLPERPALSHIRRLQGMKTGALIAFACESGAILGQAPRRERAALKAFGEALGVAFQVADDLLDAEGNAATVGKAVAKDAAQGKATLVSLMGIEDARAELARLEAQALDALTLFEARADTLRAAARFVVRRKR
ncbi:MAG TPA: farnesyl diphosphate synthase [Hyphomicrobiaceae bacterium]|nr:farnesyl diphosphate synthase [Hyphomicrobiaceae bacterium]